MRLRKRIPVTLPLFLDVGRIAEVKHVAASRTSPTRAANIRDEDADTHDPPCLVEFILCLDQRHQVSLDGIVWVANVKHREEGTPAMPSAAPINEGFVP